MNINLYLLKPENFIKVNSIHNKLEERIPESNRFYLKKIENQFYLINKTSTIHHLISYDSNNYQVTKFIELVEELMLINMCEFDENKWIENIYLNTTPKIENNLKYFTLSAISKLLKENRDLKNRIEFLESKFL